MGFLKILFLRHCDCKERSRKQFIVLIFNRLLRDVALAMTFLDVSINYHAAANSKIS